MTNDELMMNLQGRIKIICEPLEVRPSVALFLLLLRRSKAAEHRRTPKALPAKCERTIDRSIPSKCFGTPFRAFVTFHYSCRHSNRSRALPESVSRTHQQQRE